MDVGRLLRVYWGRVGVIVWVYVYVGVVERSQKCSMLSTSRAPSAGLSAPVAGPLLPAWKGHSSQASSAIATLERRPHFSLRFFAALSATSIAEARASPFFAPTFPAPPSAPPSAPTTQSPRPLRGLSPARCATMLFARPWASVCLLAGSLAGVQSLGLSEDPDIKAISVRAALAALDPSTANSSAAPHTQPRVGKSPAPPLETL